MWLVIVLTIFIAFSTAQATLLVNAIVTPTNGGLFDYDFSVTNNGTEDVSIVSIPDAPFGELTIDLTLVAPVGYLASYDSGLGIIDFLEDTDLFTVGSTRNGFAFTSASGPDSNFMTFDALTIDGNLISGQIRKDLRPGAVVPEPGTIVLLAFGLGCLFLRSSKMEVMK